MKKLLFTGLFLLCCLWLHAQTVTGRVYRAGTDTIIAGATVYYGGSMAGTTTNSRGRFELQAKQQQVPVIVSCIGYYTQTVIYKPGEMLIVYLKPKQEGLKTVVIRADGMSRDEEIKIFKREFLGTSAYALSCTIVNIDDIDFFYNKHTEILTASCDKPIIIENKKLGYILTYFLDSFERKPKEVHFTGNYIFKESLVSDVSAMAKIKRNRESVYENSRMQLIRAIWAHTIKKTGFRLYTSYFDVLTEDSIVVRDSLQREYLRLPGKMIISHSSYARYTTVLTPIQKFAFIDKDGYYTAGAVKWAGRLTVQRIGDLLPFEYQSEKEIKGQNLPDTMAVATVAAKGSLNLSANGVKKNKAAERELQRFKAIVLVNDNPIVNQPVVRKWARPISYKIYGSCGNPKLDKILAMDVRSLFNFFSKNSGVHVNQASADSTVNFFIMLSGNPESYTRVLPPDVMAYFNAHAGGVGYYSYSDTSFTTMTKFLHLDKMDDPVVMLPIMASALRQHIFNGLGFFNFLGVTKGSVFNIDVNLDSWTPQVGDRDIDIIRTLYQPAVKSGMTEKELDAELINQVAKN